MHIINLSHATRALLLTPSSKRKKVSHKSSIVFRYAHYTIVDSIVRSIRP